MKINVICQVRMGSTRLPGKSMRLMNGKPMIGWLIDTLEKVECNKVLYVVPSEDYETPLGAYLWKRNCEVVWGPREPRTDINDVATLFKIAVEKHPCDAFVRVCGDSPMLQPRCVKIVVDLMEGGGPYIHYGLGPGYQAQGIETALFLKALPHFSDEDREHVLLYFDKAFSGVVDTEEDFRRVEKYMQCQRLQS